MTEIPLQASYQHKKKSLRYSIYDGVTHRDPSVKSGLRVSVQPASHVRFLYEETPKVYVLPAHKKFTTFCAPFPS